MATRVIPVLQRKSSVQEVGERIVEMLDEIERRVESLRDAASHIEVEKDSLMEMLNTVQANKHMLQLGQGDREDIEATSSRLLARCKSVQVVVATPRNREQEAALRAVTEQIDTVLAHLVNDMHISKETLQRFLNACSPEQPEGPIDQRFQTSVIECTADDQKRVRRRLNQLLLQLERANQTIDPQY